MTEEPHGLDRGLTNHGDRDFARFPGRIAYVELGFRTLVNQGSNATA